MEYLDSVGRNSQKLRVENPSKSIEKRSEFEEACDVCFYIIDHPPREYRIVKQAIQGLVHLSADKDHLRPIFLLKLIQVLQQAHIYRSNPRRFAVRSIGQLAYHDEKMVGPALELLSQLVNRKSEASQFVRKGAFCALSRIGRKYPETQDTIIPIFDEHFNDPNKASITWGILIGYGRMSQSNSLLRARIANKLIEACKTTNFRVRWGGIKALGHASCAIGNVANDVSLQQKTFELATELLKNGGYVPTKEEINSGENLWKKEEVYLVQYAAMQALGLLIRSNPEEWWAQLSPIFCEALISPKYAAMVKASVMLTYGKLSYYMTQENPYNKGVVNLLLELSKNSNILVAEPAIYSLVNYALVHQHMYDKVKDILQSKMGGHLSEAGETAMLFYLKSWCKLIARNYRPTLSHSVSVTSLHSILLLPEGQNTVVPGFSSNLDEFGNENILPQQLPQEDDKHFLNSLTESETSIAQDASRLLELCTDFTSPIIQSLVALMTEPSLWDHLQFLESLKVLIQECKNQPTSLTEVDQRGLLKHYRTLVQLDQVLKENAVAMMKFPEILENPLWRSNIKTLISHYKSKSQSPVLQAPEPYSTTLQTSIPTPSMAPPYLEPHYSTSIVPELLSEHQEYLDPYQPLISHPPPPPSSYLQPLPEPQSFNSQDLGPTFYPSSEPLQPPLFTSSQQQQLLTALLANQILENGGGGGGSEDWGIMVPNQNYGIAAGSLQIPTNDIHLSFPNTNTGHLPPPPPPSMHQIMPFDFFSVDPFYGQQQPPPHFQIQQVMEHRGKRRFEETQPYIPEDFSDYNEEGYLAKCYRKTL